MCVLLYKALAGKHTHFFFRCDIPVVIMGETGCGKTRLIRYMCDMQTWDCGVNNLVMLKVTNIIHSTEIILRI